MNKYMLYDVMLLILPTLY